jgi:hypothetical protein
MTVAGKTAQLLQPAAPFARWSAVLSAGLGCLALAVVVATFPLGSMAGKQSEARLDPGVTVQRALEPAHLSLWIAKVAS